VVARERSSELTRERLIEAARVSFSRHGYHAATTAQIAAAAGFSEPTLFKQFGSKQALFKATIQDTAESMLAILDEPVPPSADAFDVLVERLRGLLSHPLLGQLSRLRSFALALPDEIDLRDTPGVDAFEARVAAAVAAGQASGTIRADVDPRDIGRLAFAVGLLFGFRSAVEGDAAAAAELAPLADSLATLLRAPERHLS
jgi:AcrR family transcriptional regulator